MRILKGKAPVPLTPVAEEDLVSFLGSVVSTNRASKVFTRDPETSIYKYNFAFVPFSMVFCDETDVKGVSCDKVVLFGNIWCSVISKEHRIHPLLLQFRAQYELETGVPSNKVAGQSPNGKSGSPLFRWAAVTTLGVALGLALYYLFG